tara:strand:+ start:461 stop:706 length:246 start_codon:yes stop_codon:yes gene_type:complete
MIQETDSDKILVKTIGSTIVKISFFVCLSVVFLMSLSTCNIDEEVIKQCQQSCSSSGGMKEVTGTSCECSENSSNQWVLPR